VIRQFFTKVCHSLWRKRWFLLVGFFLVGGGILARPHLRAWYHLRAGREAEGLYHDEEALAHLKDCLSTWPANKEAQFLAARSCRRLGDFPQARDYLRECQRLENTPSEGTVLEWELLRASSGDLDQVESHLINRLERNPAVSSLVREALAQGCMRLLRFRQALSILDDWLADEPENTQALYLRGSTKQQMGAVAPAAEDHQKAVSLDPKRDDARLQLARLWLKSGRYEEALTQFEYLHKRKPTDSQLSVTLARCLMELNRRPEAQT
jgi:Tfp pilus assembly protein PilF